jgi:hypothetical protein
MFRCERSDHLSEAHVGRLVGTLGFPPTLDGGGYHRA